MTKTTLNAACHQVFTGLPPRLKASDEANQSFPVSVIGIRSLTTDGALLPDVLDDFLVDGPLPQNTEPLCINDVLLSIRGSAPKSTLIESEFPSPHYASGNLAVLRPNIEIIHPSYLWSVLLGICQKPRHPLLSRASTQQLSIRIKDLTELAVDLPPLDQQRAIGKAALALRDALLAEQNSLIQGQRTFSAFLEQYCSDQ